MFSPLNCAFVCFAGQGSRNASILAYLCFESKYSTVPALLLTAVPAVWWTKRGWATWAHLSHLPRWMAGIAWIGCPPRRFFYGLGGKKVEHKVLLFAFFDLAQLQKLIFIVNLRLPKKVTQFRSNHFFQTHHGFGGFFVYFFRSVGDGVGDAKGRGNWVSCGGGEV